MDCIFCKIIKGEIPSYTIYEDDIVKCFLDIEPEAPGHTLIIPKKHFENIVDIDIDTLSHINLIAKKIYGILNKKLSPDGIKVIQNNGCVQEVKHYHMHIIPVYENKKNLEVKDIFEMLK